MNNLSRTIATAFVLIFAGISFAQVDERARELLEGAAAQTDIGEVRTMEQVTTTHMHLLGISTTTRAIIDFENERAVVFSEPTGTVLRYVDGVIRMELDGTEVPLPPEIVDPFTDIFDEANNPEDLDYEDMTATYDGVVNYADVLTGHQVTYTGGQLLNPALGSLVGAEVRYIFDDAGRLIGAVGVGEMEGVDIVTVITGEPVIEGMMLSNMEMYQVENHVATLYATLSFEEASVNEPVDETLFE